MSSRRHFLRGCAVAGVVGFGGLAGCIQGDDPGTATTTDDPTTNTNTNSTTGTTTDDGDGGDGPGDGRVAWEQSFSGLVEHSPAVAGDALYVGDENGTVSALARDDGTVRWRAGHDHPIQGTPVVVDGTVIAVSGRMGLGQHQVVTALAADSGEERWTFAPDDWWLEILGVTDGLAFVASSDDAVSGSGQTLYAVSLADGSTQWSVEVGDESGGLVADGRVYVPSNGIVDSVGVDGTGHWSVEVPRYRFKSIAVTDGVAVYVSAEDPREATVHAVDAASGDTRWSFDEWSAYTTAVDDEGRLFVGGERVARLDPVTGEALWTTDQRAALYDAPIVDGTLYTPGDTPSAISVEDGSVEWTTEVDAHLATVGGFVADAFLLRVSLSRDDRNRRIVALDAGTGEARWTFEDESDRELVEPATGTDRAFVAAGSDLYALDV